MFSVIMVWNWTFFFSKLRCMSCQKWIDFRCELKSWNWHFYWDLKFIWGFPLSFYKWAYFSFMSNGTNSAVCLMVPVCDDAHVQESKWTSLTCESWTQICRRPRLHREQFGLRYSDGEEPLLKRVHSGGGRHQCAACKWGRNVYAKLQLVIPYKTAARRTIHRRLLSTQGSPVAVVTEPKLNFHQAKMIFYSLGCRLIGLRYKCVWRG